MEQVEIHRGDEWTAVYLNGELVQVGEHYLANQWICQHYGVRVVNDMSFMRGQNHRSGVATTLDEVATYKNARETRQREAALLRETAAGMIQKARDLETQA